MLRHATYGRHTSSLTKSLILPGTHTYEHCRHAYLGAGQRHSTHARPVIALGQRAIAVARGCERCDRFLLLGTNFVRLRQLSLAQFSSAGRLLLELQPRQVGPNSNIKAAMACIRLAQQRFAAAIYGATLNSLFTRIP